MNTYTKLKFHLERHMYKRGAHKGDAPAGPRWRSYVRVIKGNDDSMRVRMYGTDMITAYPDGSGKINTDGWYDRPSTQWRINEAFSFMPYYIALSHRKVMGVSQPALRVPQGQVLFYDGITLDAEGTITSPLRCFERRQINKAESAELRADMKESGFTDAFKLLHAVVDETTERYSRTSVVRHAYHSNDWPSVIAQFAQERKYDYLVGRYEYTKKTPQQTWASLMQYLRKELYEIVKTDITVL